MAVAAKNDGERVNGVRIAAAAAVSVATLLPFWSTGGGMLGAMSKQTQMSTGGGVFIVAFAALCVLFTLLKKRGVSTVFALLAAAMCFVMLFVALSEAQTVFSFSAGIGAIVSPLCALVLALSGPIWRAVSGSR